ncbi:MAG: 4'-phosphopantetheinyl transferase superfamily protein [Deltaproteobacteria bacterium]|nr:4'-phosphopantetheinyl transferase superfamily protein [Deltaproteobacteria bacterium]
MTLFPVVMPVIEAGHKRQGQQKVAHLSRIAREALKLSAEKSQVKLGELLKDEKGVPRPVAGIYWSLSHKPEYVAAVVSKNRVGIDIEEIKARDELLFAHVASDEEWELKERSWDTFFRYWTAKEAILKVIGIGISGLKTCRIISVPDENHIALDYKGQFFLVEQLRYKNQIVSVLKNGDQIEWVVLSKSQIPDTKS